MLFYVKPLSEAEQNEIILWVAKPACNDGLTAAGQSRRPKRKRRVP